jgi:hypothetical protein
MSERPGFVSAAGVVVAVVVLAIVVSWTLVMGPVLFSPGSLNSVASAKQLGGVSTHADLAHDCAACHTPPWSPQTMTDKCLGCHEDIAAQMKSGTTVHGRLVGKLSSPTCHGCHTEHGGSQGSLTVIDAQRFPHDLTGYSLRGHEHKSDLSSFACTDCHPKDLGQFDQAVCADCHAKDDPKFMSEHEASFGKSCLLCHDGSSSDGKNFDHNKLAFKLTGKHSEVPCGSCHSNAVSLKNPNKTPRDCYACHAKDDEHGGSFGQQCDQCHSTSTWKNAKFDHKVFPVNHKSKSPIPCKTCHPNGTKTYTCYGCHEHTPANTQAEHRKLTPAQLADCIRCHKGGKGGD